MGFQRLKVRRPVPQGPTAGCAGDDLPTPGVCPAQQAASTRQIPFPDALADLGARNGEFVLDVGGDVLDFETVGLTTGPEEFLIALPSGTESVVVADDDGGRSKPFDQDIPHEVLRTQSGEGLVE